MGAGNVASLRYLLRGRLAIGIPHRASLLVGTLEELVRDAELVVVGHLEPSRRDLLAGLLGDRNLIDLSGAPR